ncbi:MAG: hypothetical protein ACK4TN_00210, partial [Brevinematales bacterium]
MQIWDKIAKELSRSFDSDLNRAILEKIHFKEIQNDKIIVLVAPDPLTSGWFEANYRQLAESLAFKIKGKDKEYFLAWTTTPWTLPGNVALAVGKELDYVEVEIESKERMILGKDRLSVLTGKYKIVREMKGRDLIGIKYEPLFYIKETQNESSHKIISADFVKT